MLSIYRDLLLRLCKGVHHSLKDGKYELPEQNNPFLLSRFATACALMVYLYIWDYPSQTCLFVARVLWQHNPQTARRNDNHQNRVLSTEMYLHRKNRHLRFAN